MKGTKVYVDELPKCIFCPMLVNLSNIGESEELMCCLNRTAYCNDYSDIEKIERNFKLACPLKSLKAHDRELARQVCEKISIELENETETYCEIRQCSSPHYQGDYVWFNYVKFRIFIAQILKEFEK